MELCHTVPAMADRRCIVLKYEGKVPLLAGCTACQRKFFTPDKLVRDAAGAEQYLLDKFYCHDCPREPKTIREVQALETKP